jgi:hypothetical protein
MRRTARITDMASGRRAALLFVGSAAALLGVGVGAGAASAATTAPARTAVTSRDAAAFRTANAADAMLDAALVKGPVSLTKPASHAAASIATSARPAPAAHAPAGPAQVKLAAAKAAPAAPKPLTWAQVAEVQAQHADPKLGAGPLPAADQLRPVPVYGQQETMPLDTSQVGNATTIVHQALAKGMGVRSAVIAVATSMQESTLNNINYGTSDSLGLFQQRPSCGWGTAQQILDPAYAADAFLGALKTYQAGNPDWASQPLWQTAQGVQQSGFPTAYAKWEAQAASLVQGITMHLTK